MNPFAPPDSEETALQQRGLSGRRIFLVCPPLGFGTTKVFRDHQREDAVEFTRQILMKMFGNHQEELIGRTIKVLCSEEPHTPSSSQEPFRVSFQGSFLSFYTYAEESEAEVLGALRK